MALKHTVTDTDNNFSINPTTRVIKNESPGKNYIIQYDHNSERFSFEIPRVIEGHDLYLCDHIEVHYVNIDGKTQLTSPGVYEVTDRAVSDQDPTMLIFSWLISQNATRYVGPLNFLIRFYCIDDSGNLCYVWNTTVHNGIAVSNGLCNSEYVLEEYADVLQAWKNEIDAFRLVSLTAEESEVDEGINEWIATFADGVTKKLKVKNGSKGDPGEGTPGKSAYAYAQENGFGGTEQEFKDSLLVPQFYEGTTKLKTATFKLEGTTLKITTT